ncbi:MAG: hypothetical protein H7Y02_01035, partial [Candidatus Obscuribacterales bacterium]|nr:hypothetical protein [Steroidobacteraceae bacterium]
MSRARIAQRSFVVASLFAASVVTAVAFAVWWQQQGAAYATITHALPVEPSLLLLLAPCILALLGLEFGHRMASACLAAVVVVVITVTIGGWVLHQAQWLGYHLFATPGAEQLWFPSAHGVAGAIP